MADLTVEALLAADVVDLSNMKWGGLTIYFRPLSVTAAMKAQSMAGSDAAEHMLKNSVVNEDGELLFTSQKQVKEFCDKFPMTEVNKLVRHITKINEIDDEDKDGSEGKA